MGRFLGFGIALLLTGCATASQQPAVPRSVRELTEAEKGALARTLSVTLKDPESARYMWMPVTYLPGSSVTDYCALVNSKNSYGGYVGFHKFHAVLQQDANGQYVNGRIDRIGQDDLGTDDVGVAWNNGWLDGSCGKFGYSDFSQAK